MICAAVTVTVLLQNVGKFSSQSFTWTPALMPVKRLNAWYTWVGELPALIVEQNKFAVCVGVPELARTSFAHDVGVVFQ